MISLKKLFGKIIFYSGYYHLFSSLKSLLGKKEVAILMYHRVSDDSLDVKQYIKNFDEQMRYLSNNYDVITFDELLEFKKDKKRLLKNSAIITFDDGYKDNYLLAYPILKKYSLPGTIFLTTGYISKNRLFWWDKIEYIIRKTKIKKFALEGVGEFSLANKQKAIMRVHEILKKMDEFKREYTINQLERKLRISKPRIKKQFLSWQDIKEMSKNHISFGAHTVTHPILTRIGLKQAKNEILTSKNRIEREIKQKVSVFAYPNGCKEDMSDKIDEFLKEKNFSFALSTIYGLNRMSLFRLKRIGIEPSDNLMLFRIKLSGIGKSLAPYYLKYLK